MQEIDYLLYIAKHAGLFNPLESSTSQIAKDLKLPQQSVSRNLIKLEKSEFIERTGASSGIALTLTEKGIQYLRKYHEDLTIIFHPKASLKCTVTSGLGEGKFYMSLPGYQKQFKDKLGYNAFAGTLNAKISVNALQAFLLGKKKIRIEGFATKERTYGGIDAFPATIEKIQCAIIIPDRTSHDKEVIEIIAPKGLRKALNIKDRQIVALA